MFEFFRKIGERQMDFQRGKTDNGLGLFAEQFRLRSAPKKLFYTFLIFAVVLGGIAIHDTFFK